MAVNDERFDYNIQRPRELDIVTKKCIIEIKGGKASSSLKQLLAQKRFAEGKNKKRVFYAPEIYYNTMYDYRKHGIEVKKSIKELIQFIKENKQ